MNSIHIAVLMFKRLFGDWKGWMGYLVLPVLILSVIVHFLSDDGSIRPMQIGYFNQDEGVLGEHLVESISSKEGYMLIVLDDEQELRGKIINGQIVAAFIIPADFTQGLLGGEPAQVQQYFLTLSENTFLLEHNLEQAISQLALTIEQLSLIETEQMQLLERLEQVILQQQQGLTSTLVVDNQLYANNSIFLVIGFMLFFVMMLVFNSIGVVLEDRQQMTMLRIYSAPVRAWQIALGNFFGSFGLGALQIFVVLMITKYVFGYDYGVGFIPLFIILSFFILATVGIGSAVAGLVKNSHNLSALSSLIIVPTCMLGGCWWPLAIMPDTMQTIANFVPQTWAIAAVETLAAGEGFSQIAIHLGILALFSIILLGFGSIVLKPSEEGV